MNMLPATMRFRFYLFLLSISCCLFSCVNLKTVSEFSSTSLLSVKNFEEIDYTFWDHCIDRCEDEAIKKFEFQRALACSCEVYVAADSVTQVMLAVR